MSIFLKIKNIKIPILINYFTKKFNNNKYQISCLFIYSSSIIAIYENCGTILSFILPKKRKEAVKEDKDSDFLIV